MLTQKDYSLSQGSSHNNSSLVKTKLIELQNIITGILRQKQACKNSIHVYDKNNNITLLVTEH